MPDAGPLDFMEDEIDNGVRGLAILVGMAAITMFVALCVEIARVHIAVWNTSARRYVLYADAAMALILALSGAIMGAPGQAALALHVAAWSFLIYVIVIEFCAGWGTAPEELPGGDNLDTYLSGDWSQPLSPPSPSGNGHASTPLGSVR
jgi:hypothetical protein